MDAVAERDADGAGRGLRDVDVDAVQAGLRPDRDGGAVGSGRVTGDRDLGEEAVVGSAAAQNDHPAAGAEERHDGVVGRYAARFEHIDGIGFWEREPDTWSFERPYDEVALILEGDADIVADDGRTLTVGPGDVLVTPKGSAGTWVIRERIVKFWVIYDG
jgi:uncharacterized cupin superfamily protein